MRKHDVRKWLHAVLDLLPVILIPVFMIYSHRHTIDSGSIQVPQNQVVDFNQLVNPNNLTGSTTYETDYYICSAIYDDVVIQRQFNPLFTAKENNIYYVKSNIPGQYLPGTYGLFNDTLGYIQLNNGLFNSTINGNVDLNFSFDEIDLHYNVNVYNLTQMFGIGNEPTAAQFDTWYNDYYAYTLSHKELLKGTSTITYDDTYIMSQVVYQLYNSVDKYFNMGNVFNMTGVYDWFNLNIFNGNAPISIYIVWNIVLYEFVMDLLFLLYGLFMWFIDMVEKLMEKPLKSVK